MFSFSVLTAFYILFYLVVFIGWIMHKKSRDSGESTILLEELTVLIPFRNEHANLKHLLTQLGELEKTPHQFIFINDHSEDKGHALLETHKGELIEVISLDQDKQGKKTAIYEGVKQVNTKYVLCWDADITFGKDYFEHIQNLKTADLLILPVHFTSKTICQSAGEIDFYLANFVNQASSYWLRPIMCNGANLLFDKHSYLEVIKLENHQNVLSGDDMFLLRNMQKSSKNIHLVSGDHCSVSTDSPKSIKHFFQQRNRWFGKSFLINDQLLNLWAGVQFAFSVSYLFLFTYWLVEDAQLMLLILLIKTGIDLLFLFAYFAAIRKIKLLLLIPIYGIIFPIYNLVLLCMYFFTNHTWKGRKLYT